MIKLAETYLRLDFHLEREEQVNFQNALTAVAKRVAAEHFRQTPEVAVFVEDGSVKTWIVFAGSLYAAIAAYGSFRSGLDYLVNDAKAVGSSIVAAVQEAGVSDRQLLRAERRTGIPGKLRKIVKEVDRLEADEGRISRQERAYRMQEVRRKLISVVGQIDDEQDRSVTLNNFPEEIRENLPSNIPKLPRLGMPMALRPEEFGGAPPQRYLMSMSAGGLIPPNSLVHADLAPTYQVITDEGGFRLVPIKPLLARA